VIFSHSVIHLGYVIFILFNIATRGLCIHSCIPNPLSFARLLAHYLNSYIFEIFCCSMFFIQAYSFMIIKDDANGMNKMNNDLMNRIISSYVYIKYNL